MLMGVRLQSLGAFGVILGEEIGGRGSNTSVDNSDLILGGGSNTRPGAKWDQMAGPFGNSKYYRFSVIGPPSHQRART
jgi:hypothetical protein